MPRKLIISRDSSTRHGGPASAGRVSTEQPGGGPVLSWPVCRVGYDYARKYGFDAVRLLRVTQNRGKVGRALLCLLLGWGLPGVGLWATKPLA